MRRALILTCLAACSSTQVRVETVEGQPGPRPKSYALLDFVNRTEDPRAADSVRGSLLHVIESGGGRVVDATAARQVDPERLDRDVARKLAEQLGVDAVLTGTVFAYGYVPAPDGAGGLVPTVRVDVRLVAKDGSAASWVARVQAEDDPEFPQSGASLTRLLRVAMSEVVESLTDD